MRRQVEKHAREIDARLFLGKAEANVSADRGLRRHAGTPFAVVRSKRTTGGYEGNNDEILDGRYRPMRPRSGVQRPARLEFGISKNRAKNFRFYRRHNVEDRFEVDRSEFAEMDTDQGGAGRGGKILFRAAARRYRVPEVRGGSQTGLLAIDDRHSGAGERRRIEMLVS